MAAHFHTLAAAESQDDLIVRMFHLNPPDPSAIRWFLVALGGALLILMGMWVAGLWRERRRRHAVETRNFRRLLSSAGLNRVETEALRRIAQASGAPAIDCAAEVEIFDRGIDRLLSTPLDREARQNLLRALHDLRRKLGLHRTRRGAPIRSTRALPRSLPVFLSPAGAAAGEMVVNGTLFYAGEEFLTLQLEGGTEALQPLRGAAEVEAVFFRPGDASYSFQSRVIGLHELDSAFLVLAHPASLVRTQKRRSLRVEVEEEVRFRWIPEARLRGETPPVQSREALLSGFAGTIVDLSAGGIRLRTTCRLARGDILVLTLPYLPVPHKSEMCSARVVRDYGDGSYGLSFERMRPQVQAAVAQYIRLLEVKSAAAAAAEARRSEPAVR